MLIKGIQDESITDYKKISMVIAFPHCSFKCDKEHGLPICQNGHLRKEKNIKINAKDVVDRYLQNPLSQAIVFGGLEPFDSLLDMCDIAYELREKQKCMDDIVIYTGYREEEVHGKVAILLNNIGWSNGRNIIVKYGRFIPNQEPHYDEILGVKLASDNQYGKRLFE